MDLKILDEAKQFLIEYCKDKKCIEETIHPWRKDGKFVVVHSLRVENYVKKILSVEKHNLSQDEIILIRLLAILHDVGRIIQREEHAKYSKEIVENWLNNNPKIKKQIFNVDKLLYMIENHSDKESEEKDFGFAVFKDADELDEIGVLSIFMASNRIDKDSAFFFNFLLDRVRNFEIAFCDKKMNKLNTLTAKKILADKKQFIEKFLRQLDQEIDGTHDMFEDINFEQDEWNL